MIREYIYFIDDNPNGTSGMTEEEIIRCKDCKHFVRDDVEVHTPYGFYDTYFHAFCDKHYDKEQGEYIDVKPDDFCSFAERRVEQ